MKKCFLLNLFILFLIAIVYAFYFFNDEQKASKELWIAKENVSVYSVAFSRNNEVLFELEVGDICTPLRMIFDKDSVHTEIVCKKGQGWVESSFYFEIIKPKKKE